MFKIESYITPILLNYVDKYVKDFKPHDAQVSLWGGGVALYNLVLKTDVLQHEWPLPFTLVSGRINELLIKVPWTKIMSEPIVVTIDTIECILSHRTSEEEPPSEPQHRTQVVEAPPGYMQALVKRVVSNITLNIQHLILKYVKNDIVLSLNINQLSFNSAGDDWKPTFADIDQNEPILRRLITVDDLTLCLDRADPDGKIRFYQEPLLCRCQLKFRLLTRFISPTTRRALSHYIQLTSGSLAFSISNEQVTLLLRLICERSELECMGIDQATNKLTLSPTAPLDLNTSLGVDANINESWSEWAWSWLPSWLNKDVDVEEATLPATPCIIRFVMCLDAVSLVFKIMETDFAGKKRPRGEMAFIATYVAAKGSICAPTHYQISMGARTVLLESVSSNCSCGVRENHSIASGTTYLSKYPNNDSDDFEWPIINIETTETTSGIEMHEKTVLIDEEPHSTQTNIPTVNDININVHEHTEIDEKIIDKTFWSKMSPLIFFEFSHERTPPSSITNPYENPPKIFQYSDWVENCVLTIQFGAMQLLITTGLLHRIEYISRIFENQTFPVQELNKRVLTVEECEALLDNRPRRHINFECNNILIRLQPCDHISSVSSCSAPPVYLDIETRRISINLTAPLYPQRVCSAASQLPEEDGPLWHAAHIHVFSNFECIQASLLEPKSKRPPKRIGRVELTVIFHKLLYAEYFKKNTVKFNYTLKIDDINICGSAARLLASAHTISSIQKNKVLGLHSSLFHDALHDDDEVAIDLTVNDIIARGFITETTTTLILTVQMMKGLMLDAPSGANTNPAWLLSAPDTPKASPFLRVSAQFCKMIQDDFGYLRKIEEGMEYLGVWIEPINFCINPLLLKWLSYQSMNNTEDTVPVDLASSSNSVSRKTTPTPSCSGRTSKPGSSSEYVHTVRPRSHESSSDPSEKMEPKLKIQPLDNDSHWWEGHKLVHLHDRLRYVLLNIEWDVVTIYITTTTVAAVDSVCVYEAIERHAENGHPVTAFCLGRISMHCNTVMKPLWMDVRYDGPTVFSLDRLEEDADCFPWKMRWTNISFYNFEVQPKEKNIEKMKRSRLKTHAAFMPKGIIDDIEHAITLSIITKTTPEKSPANQSKKYSTMPSTNDKTKYFTSGFHFKPTTIKDFIRGPSKPNQHQSEERKELHSKEEQPCLGKLVSMGICIHFDTRYIICKLNYNQINLLKSSIHCMSHLFAGFKNIVRELEFQSLSSLEQLQHPNQHRTLAGSHDESEENKNDELVSIYIAPTDEPKLKTSIWCQWILNQVGLSITNNDLSRIQLNLEDIITTLDLKFDYKQLKFKMGSISLREFRRSNTEEDWTSGPFDGRVITVSDSSGPYEESHCVTCIITQADVASLPASWKAELHPGMKSTSIWEITANFAMLDIIIRPVVLENCLPSLRALAYNPTCSLPKITGSQKKTQWPLCFINAKGFKLFLTTDEESSSVDRCFMFYVNPISITPNPDNPICRRTLVGCDVGQGKVGTGFEGRQYEFTSSGISLYIANLTQIIRLESDDSMGGENPAVIWTQSSDVGASNCLRSIFHSSALACLFAPSLFVDKNIICGPALEFILMKDLSIGINQSQLKLMSTLAHKLSDILNRSNDIMEQESSLKETCLYFSNSYRQKDSGQPSDKSEDRKPDSENQSVTSTCFTNTSSFYRCMYNDNNIKRNGTGNFLDHLEIFATFGTIQLSLNAEGDEEKDLIKNLKPTHREDVASTSQRDDSESVEESVDEFLDDSKRALSMSGGPPSPMQVDVSPSHADMARLNLTLPVRNQNALALMNVIFYQPNLYHTRSQNQTQTQISVFNFGITVLGEDGTQEPLFSTNLGQRDVVTDIPPSLCTIKIILPITNDTSSNAGNIRIDIERPIMININFNKIKRLKSIFDLLNQCRVESRSEESIISSAERLPLAYNIWRKIVARNIGAVAIKMTQFGICGEDGLVGFDSASLQLSSSSRPQLLSCKCLLTGFLISMGSTSDERHPLVHPQIIGIELESIWATWRRAEEGIVAKYPTTRLRIDFNYMTIDLRAQDVITICKLLENVKQNMQQYGITLDVPKEKSYDTTRPNENKPRIHFYHDDLRTGAFKTNVGYQVFPLPYQIVICDDTLSWCYPHPRAITRVVVHPLSAQKDQIECALEGYSYTLEEWQLLTDFSIKIGEPSGATLQLTSPDAMFTNTWRIRVKSIDETADQRARFQFDLEKYTTANIGSKHSINYAKNEDEVKIPMEELLRSLMIDSYFSPETFPETSIACRTGGLMLHLHNSMSEVFKLRNSLGGYYISKPMMKCHRTLSLEFDNILSYMQNSSKCGKFIFIDTTLSCSIVDSDTGTMNEIIKPSVVHLAASLWTRSIPKIRIRTKHLHFKLNVPRLNTLKRLIQDWSLKTKQPLPEHEVKELDERRPDIVFNDTVSAMSGKITLWVHNNTVLELKFGQVHTEEVLYVGVGVKVAYRWYRSDVERRLRFGLARTPLKWQDNETAIDLTVGEQAIVLSDAKSFGEVVHLYAKVEEIGVAKCIFLTGRLHLANMLNSPLLYTIRNVPPANNAQLNLCSGEIGPETVCLSILCSSEKMYILKIKFPSDDVEGIWSGDIPLQECKRGNKPWLVKVPRAEDNMKYVSLWCRVVESTSDGRILASIWPMYSLRSYLPLDINIHLTSSIEEDDFTGYVKSFPSRGYSNDLLMPGTTSTFHELSFRYMYINTLVTRESVPLNYGVADRSMFQDRVQVNDVHKIINDINQWMLARKTLQHEWPYCIVKKHISTDFIPSEIQSRADCSINYKPVNVCGGCSLEIELRPKVIFCNASPVTITLCAFNASPVCKLKSTYARVLASVTFERSFFMSIEIEPEIYVSEELELYHEVVGLYDTLPKGKVALEHPLKIGIHCHDKVASLTIYYEVKELINILSVTSTHVIINQLKCPILVSPIVVPTAEDRPVNLVPTSFTYVPQKHGKIEEWSGVALCEFLIHGRWRGGEISELDKYLCIALPVDENTPAHAFVPIKIEDKDIRRAIAVKNCDNKSIPVVITQQHHEGRCIITVAEDPCPQFVIHNKTKETIAVAKPSTQVGSSTDTVIQDCPGVSWYNSIAPNTWMHYSAPDYCAIYPPIVNNSHSDGIPNKELTFAIIKGQKPKWCASVEICEGEQLLQLESEDSIKIQTHNYPHSTLIVLLNSDANDISARDIRMRLSSPIENTALVNMEVGVPLNMSTLQSSSSSLIKRDVSSARSSFQYDASVELPIVSERIRATIDGITVELADLPESNPLIDVHLDYINADYKTISESATQQSEINLAITDMQIDNKKHASGEYDFAVIATTVKNNKSQVIPPWGPIWRLLNNYGSFNRNNQELSKIRILAKFEHWQIFDNHYSELTELNVMCSPLELYVEDNYIASLITLYRLIVPETTNNEINTNAVIMRAPIRLKLFTIHAVDLVLTLHTSTRMYISLGQCPVRLGEFRLTNLMTSPERFVHALIAHYLSAAVLNAGWMISGLELLGAPGTIASRISSASSGGVRSVATSIAAALLWSVSSWAGSFARNLDLLAGDEEHALRVAAVRRHSPDTLVAALRAGFSNFAINILGAVGGLVHHPFVGVAVGENDSRVAGLRRGLVGAVTKPISAIADLLALAGQGILRQTGWDPLPHPRILPASKRNSGWARNCVRWCFRSNATTLAGFEVQYNDANVYLLLTHEDMFLIDPQTEKVLDCIALEFCTVTDVGPPLMLNVNKERVARIMIQTDDDDYEITGYAMERVARYLGAEEGAVLDSRTLTIQPTPKELHHMYALLITLIHHNHENHFKFL